MVDSTISYERCMEAAGVAFSSGDRISAERALRSAIQSVDGVENMQLEQASALTRLGSLLQELGRDSEAEESFRKALSISEGHLGEDHPDLVLLLNDLTRLYLKQSQHALAEPLLLRLLAIKRSKGDDHPEVATVLASLATVRQALGRYEAAEQLWRRVLGIRERTLAPNHFSLATAIEHLAETCAARGKLREALQYFERSHAIREHTLGADHPSLRVSRERIADLQLQASEDSMGGDALPAVEPRRIASGGVSIAAPPAPADATSNMLFELDVAPAPPVAAPAPAPMPSAAPPAPAPARPVAAEKASPFAPAARERAVERPITYEKKTAVAAAPALSPNAVAVDAAIASLAQPQQEAVPYLNVLMDIKQELDEPELEEAAPAPKTSRAAALVAGATALFQKHRVATVVGIAVITLPVAGLAIAATTRSANSRSVEKQAFAEGPRQDSVASSLALPELAGRPIALKDTAVNPRASSQRDKSGSKSDEAAPSNDVPAIVIPKVQTSDSKIDSVVKAMTVPVRTASEAMPLQLSAATLMEAPRTVPGFELASTGVRARLIGDAPTPRYPATLALSNIGGEVRVRFDVDTTGRPIMSSFSVVSSPNSALSIAVKKAIPSMRFEPARSAADNKAVVDKVEMGFTFTPPRNNN